jgi:tetratricopeptide (TPR) repeat protein
MNHDVMRILASVHEADLMALEACEVDDPAEIRRRSLLALERSPLSVNAWCLLAAQEADGSDDQIDLLHRAMTAAQTLAGVRVQDDRPVPAEGQLTRPLVKAMTHLGRALQARGNYDGAIEAFREVLDFDPNDGFRVRYDLVKCLLLTGHIARLQRLLNHFDGDTSATWRWTRALTAFKLEQDSEEANEALEQALDSNPYIGPYLLNRLSWHGAAPAAYQAAEETEAAWYSDRFREHWDARPQAKRWLAERTGLA